MLGIWLWTHIGKESWETFSPFLAHAYAAPAIVFVLFYIGVFTSLDDVFPAHVFGGLIASVAVDKSTWIFFSITTAANNIAMANDVSVDFFGNAAFAAKKKTSNGSSFIHGGGNLTDYCKSTKCFIGHVNASGHTQIISFFQAKVK